MHPDAFDDEIERISKEILGGIPFIYDSAKCSSCGKQIDKGIVQYSSKCKQCGRVYCQLCVMNLVDTLKPGKCICNAELTPYGMDLYE